MSQYRRNCIYYYNSFPAGKGGYSLQKILKAFEERQNGTPTTKIKNSLEILEQFSKIPKQKKKFYIF